MLTGGLFALAGRPPRGPLAEIGLEQKAHHRQTITVSLSQATKKLSIGVLGAYKRPVATLPQPRGEMTSTASLVLSPLGI